MNPIWGSRRATMLVVTLTFCIISGINTLPIYPGLGGYPPAIDPYASVSPYPSVDPYAVNSVYSPSVDVYYQAPQPVSYATVDPYGMPQPLPYVPVDPYLSQAVPYPSVDPYGLPQQVPYQSVDPYGLPQQNPYQSVDPYALPQNPYQSVDPYALPQNPYQSVDPYGLPQQNPYQSLDPYGMPQPIPYPSVDPYGLPQQVPYPSVDPYAVPVDPYALPQPISYTPSSSYQPIVFYPAVDPYSVPPPLQYPTIDPLAQSSPALTSNYYQIPPPPPYSPPPSYASSDPYGLSVPQSYQLAPSYQPTPAYQSNVVLEDDTYLAIAPHTVDRRKHCGILPVTNDDIYSSDPMPGGVNDVLPYGAFPWTVLIVDTDYNTVSCLGTVVHSELVLTTSSCITKPAAKYTVIRDWDILTLYNEYEAYKSYDDPVCTYWRLGMDNSTGQTQYALGGPDAELTLLVGALEEHHDLYPADKLLCLPSRSSALPSPQPTPYGYPQPPPYSAYPQISYDYSNPSMQSAECWVAGYLNSPTAILQNHPPTAPANAQQQQPPSVDQQYYNNLDNSKVPRRALVRQVQCPSNYANAGSDDVCFVGINGYDACVADQGTAVVCVINDNTQYQSGFADDPTRPDSTTQPGYSNNVAPKQQPVQKQPIQTIQSQQKPNRQRGVLYAVVKTTTTCMTQPLSYQQQSNYIVGARVSPSIRAAIADLFWETGYDLSCPTQTPGDVLPDSGPVASPPLPYSVSTYLQPQQYDPSLSAYSIPPAPPSGPSPPLYPQLAPSPYPQVTYVG